MASSTMSNTTEYILQRYIQLGIYNADKTPNGKGFNPNLDPRTNDIPQCTSCKDDYEKGIQNKNNRVEWNHNHTCLWYNYFIERLHTKRPDVIVLTTYGTKKSSHREKICYNASCCQRYGYWSDLYDRGWTKQF